MKRTSYTIEYKIDVAKIALASMQSGGSVASTARVMGLQQSMVNRWVNQYKNGELVPQAEPAKPKKEAVKETGGSVKILKSIDGTLKKILQELKDQMPPGTLVDLVAKEMNGENSDDQRGGVDGGSC